MDYLKIGFIKKPHGIKGEVKVLPFSEDISRFKKLKKVFAQINEQFIELKLKSLKTMNDEVIIHFEGCNDRNKAEEFAIFISMLKEKMQSHSANGSIILKILLG